MIAAALAAAALVSLPEGSVRYGAELANEPVGVVDLRIACRGARCAVRYESRLRLPAESGGEVQRARVEVEVDREGRWRGGPLRAGRDGAQRDVRGVLGAVPSALLEVVLVADAEAGARCIPAFHEEEGPEQREQRACTWLEGGRVRVDLDGVGEAILSGEDGFPDEVVVESRFRFRRDPHARVPERAPRLAGMRVPGPEDPARAATFCGVALDPVPPAPPATLPPPRAAGASCREKTDAYLAAARARGLPGRTAVGVAWDGRAFVWHAWPEVRAGGAWIAVDPSFGELPASGPRFTVGRWARGDGRARSAAGARVLACWGAARVEGR